MSRIGYSRLQHPSDQPASCRGGGAAQQSSSQQNTPPDAADGAPRTVRPAREAADGDGESEAKSGRRPRGDSGEMPPRRAEGSTRTAARPSRRRMVRGGRHCRVCVWGKCACVEVGSQRSQVEAHPMFDSVWRRSSQSTQRSLRV